MNSDVGGYGMDVALKIQQTMVLNNTNHQYSEREALPRNVAYFEKTLLIDCMNVIVVYVKVLLKITREVCRRFIQSGANADEEI